MSRSTRPLVLIASLAAGAALAGCSSGSSAPSSARSDVGGPPLRQGGGDVAGPVNSPQQVVQALRVEGFHVRAYAVSGSEASMRLRRAGLHVSPAIVDSGRVRAVVATPAPDRGSLIVAYVGRTSADGMVLYRQNGEFTDPQMGDALLHVPRLSTRRNVSAIYFPPSRQGLLGPDRKRAFMAAMDRLLG